MVAESILSALRSSPAQGLGLGLLAWMLTYAIHSTLLLGAAWLGTRRMGARSTHVRERVWRFALLAGLVTASAQLALGRAPFGPRFALRSAAIAQLGALELPLAGAPSSAPDALPSAVPADIRTPRPGSAVRAHATPRASTAPSNASSAPLASAATAPESAGVAAVRRAPIVVLGSTLAPIVVPLVPKDVLLSVLASASPPDAGVASSESGPTSPTIASLFASSAPFAWTTYAALAWIAGSVTALALFALLWLRFAGCLGRRERLREGPMVEMLEDLRRRAGVRRRVRLSVAPGLSAPISLGFVRAEICVPPRALAELTDEEQEALLAHELAHLVRRDPLWLSLAQLCQGVLFFQPLNRVARRELDDCSEFLCDAWAVRHTGLRLSLASCLTRVAEWIVGDARVLPAPAMAHGRSRLGQRIERLLDEDDASRSAPRAPWVAPLGAGLCSALVLVLPCVAAVDEEPDDGAAECSVDDDPCAGATPAPECASHAACASSKEACERSCAKESEEADDADASDGLFDESDAVEDAQEAEEAPADADAEKAQSPDPSSWLTTVWSGVPTIATVPPTDELSLYGYRTLGRVGEASLAAPLARADANAWAVVSLDDELKTLDSELESLRARARALGLAERYQASFEKLESSMQAVREKRARLERWVEQVQARAVPGRPQGTGAPDASSNTTQEVWR